MTPKLFLTLSVSVALALLVLSPQADARLFVPNAVVHTDNTVTLPYYNGQSNGVSVQYLILEAADGTTAAGLGVGVAPKLRLLANSEAVQHVTIAGDGSFNFPASVDFSPVRSVAGVEYPPTTAQPGSVGEEGYSPFIQLPNGTVLNAPIIATGEYRHDKIVSVDGSSRLVTLRLTDGFSNGKIAKYLSTEASTPLLAAIESATYAPKISLSPVSDDNKSNSRVEWLAFVNGPTGVSNSQRQGLNSAVVDGLSPLNVLGAWPNQLHYSPLGDVLLASWTANPLQVTHFGLAVGLSKRDKPSVTNPDGSVLSSSGAVINGPVVLIL